MRLEALWQSKAMATLTPPRTAAAAFRFDNTFARELPGFYEPWRPAVVPAPRLLYLNRPLAEELGLDVASLEGSDGAALFAGNVVPEGADPLAQVYAGHQFGGYSPRLGDGRALLLGEVVDRLGRRRDIAFKGSGRTPFARGGDGKAAVGPMLREVLLGEAMHALGIPTTRALAVAATGEPVYREQPLPGAVLTRVAASHLRVGTFEFHASRGDPERVRKLAEYAIRRHDPELADSPQPFLGLLRNVAERQAALIAQWMNVGFIHGVMNTDNMAISGETIDYGPCAFMEAYDPAAVFSSIDEHGRYAFGNQPDIALWNLARFAETLLPLLSDDADAAVTTGHGRTQRVPRALPRAPAPRAAGQARLARHRRRCRRRRARPRLARPAPHRARGFHARLAATRRCGGRGRRALARAVREPAGARRLARALADALCRRRRQREPRSSRRRRRTRRGDARRQSLRDRAQPPRGRSAGAPPRSMATSRRSSACSTPCAGRSTRTTRSRPTPSRRLRN